MDLTTERRQDVNIDIGDRFGFICEEAPRARYKEGTKPTSVKMRHGIQRNFLCPA
jgi:hypothetical protein